MRHLVHLVMSPPCRLVRLALSEKRVACQYIAAEDSLAHLPVLVDLDGRAVTGLWAIIDYLEGMHPDPPLLPEDAAERAESLRLLDWATGHFQEEITRRIVFQKASQAHTGSIVKLPPDMQTVRLGRQALRTALTSLGELADRHGFLAAREVSLADLAIAAHLSALDYFGEVPWAEYTPIMEWYSRMKSRPSFRPLLADRVPGQPPVPHYAELDF
jgi:glutathione S-transferase